LADVLLAYSKEHAPHTARPGNIAHAVGNLEKWWGDKKLEDVTARNCRAYAAQRPQAAARRDLETLRAAIGYWHREYGPLKALPKITLPDKPEPRDRWLNREEARRLRHAAKGTPHLYRFVVLGLYTGTRTGALLATKWSWVDLGRGTILRREPGTAETKKRTPRVKAGKALLRLLRRWRKMDDPQVEFVCHYDGKQVKQLRRSFGAAVRRAGLEGVSPHTLRHTRATWLMQAGVSIWEAAGALGMSPMMLQRTYGHHHEDWQSRAAEV